MTKHPKDAGIWLVLVVSMLACGGVPGLAAATPTVWAPAPWITVPEAGGITPVVQEAVATAAIPSSASAGDPYIDQVVSFTAGNPANPAFGDTSVVLGEPDANLDALTGFLDMGVGGIIVVKFVDNLAVDGPGNDIEIYGDPMNDEEWIVEASADCGTYKSFGQVGERASLDLATVGLASASCIRITDKGRAGAASPGAELDAIEALNSSAP
jgi:hypothetical protein